MDTRPDLHLLPSEGPIKHWYLWMASQRQQAWISPPRMCTGWCQGFPLRLSNRFVSFSYKIPVDILFPLDPQWGIIIHCALENGELHRYNATMKHYLPTIAPVMQPKSSSCSHEIAHLEIHGQFVANLDQTKWWANWKRLVSAAEALRSSVLTLFTLDDRLLVVMQLRIAYPIAQLAIVSSSLLLLNAENTLLIYSIESIPKLLLKTMEFQHHSIKIHALASSFFVIDGPERQLHQLDVTSPFQFHHPIGLQHGPYLSAKCCCIRSAGVSYSIGRWHVTGYSEYRGRNDAIRTDAPR